MLSEHGERTMAHPAADLFDLAADIEQYPQFLAGWQEVHIYRREPGIVHAEQVLGAGPMRIRFHTQAVLDRPRRLDVHSNDPQFRHFSLSWQFAPESGEGCRIGLSIELELASRLLQRFVERLLCGTASEVLAAFERRADELYGARRSAP